MSVFQGAELAPGAARPPAHAGSEKAEDLSGLTNAQLQELCAERGIEVPKKATKAQLIALLGE